MMLPKTCYIFRVNFLIIRDDDEKSVSCVLQSVKNEYIRFYIVPLY
jgi:hypothetical protein